MRGAVHDGLRGLIGGSLVGLGHALEVAHRRRIGRFRRHQEALRAKYGVGPETPIREYGPELAASIEAFARRAGDVRFAETSGSLAEPKRIAFTQARLNLAKWAYVDVFARAFASLPIRRKSLYVFSALESDTSLTAMLTGERGLPPYLSTLQAPYRVHAHPAIRALAETYPPSAVRLLILTVANPGVLYATNPSTLSAFLDDVAGDWKEVRSLVRTVVTRPASLDDDVHRILRRLVSRGSDLRLARVAETQEPLSLAEIAPAVEAYVCWTGGYVAPFLHRIERYLPPDRYRRIPMYSMSTETIETITSFVPGDAAFLPLAPGVLYELLPEDAPDDPAYLVDPESAQVGQLYSLVVSDGYGLVRYQTGDLFRVRRMVRGLPDLLFERRRGLTYSFTGEKLTGLQVASVIEETKQEVDLHGAYLALVPSRPADRLPAYKLALVGGDADVDPAAFDAKLQAVNPEYASKRRSGRLGGIELVKIDLPSFAARVGGARHEKSWESQFKFLPLYTKVWEG